VVDLEREAAVGIDAGTCTSTRPRRKRLKSYGQLHPVPGTPDR
jgi:hypothetical protein